MFTGEAQRLSRKREGGGELTPRDLALLEWVETYADELEYIRICRDAIVHGQQLDNSTLERTVRLAQLLESDLDARV